MEIGRQSYPSLCHSDQATQRLKANVCLCIQAWIIKYLLGSPWHELVSNKIESVCDVSYRQFAYKNFLRGRN